MTRGIRGMEVLEAHGNYGCEFSVGVDPLQKKNLRSGPMQAALSQENQLLDSLALKCIGDSAA